MNYEQYTEFPFPAKLSPSELELQRFFLSLSDEEQLKLLGGSKSYQMFCSRLLEHSRFQAAQ